MNKGTFKAWMLAVGIASIGVSAQAQKLEDGLRATSYEQYDKAKVIFKAVKSPEAAYFLGAIYLKQGTLDSAQTCFSSIPANSPYANISKGLLAAANGDAAQAKAALDQAAPQVANNYLAAVQLGIAYTGIPGNAVQNSAAAVAVLNKAAAMKGKNNQVYLALGDAYLKGEKGTEAANAYQQAETMNPKSAESYARLAALYRFARNAKASLDYTTQGVAIDPNFGPLYREQAETYRAATKFSDAVTSYEKYLSLTDRSVASSVRYIQFLYLADNLDKANTELGNLKSKVKDFTKFPAMYRLSAISDYEVGVKKSDSTKFKTGLESMNMLFQQKSVQPLAIDYIYLGKLQSATKNDTAAIRTFETALAKDSTAATDDMYEALSKSYLATKNYKGAAMLYKRRIDKGDTALANYTYGGIYAYFSQANIDSKSEKLDTALLNLADTYLTRVASKQPAYVTAFYYKGLIHALEDPDSKKGLALPEFQKIIDMATSDQKFAQAVQSDSKAKKQLVTAYEYLIYYNFQKKDVAAAKETATKLQAIDPTNKKAEAILKQK